ncbi:MAG: AEC family transporter [Sporomusaceae bacterium]|nr:AEC family transporter [Sporomusaceae bacterium]
MLLLIKLLYFVVDVILPLCVGYLLRRFSAGRQAFFDKVIVVNLLVVYPFLTILSFWQMKISMHMLYLPILGVIMSFVPAMIAYRGSKKKYPDPLDQGSYMLAATLSNTLTLGGLVAFILYGEPGYAYTVLILLFGNLILFLFCFPMAQHYYDLSKGDKSHRISWKKILWNRNQLPTLSVFVGLGLSISGFERPAFFEWIFQALVHVGAWTALIPVGYAMDFGQIRSHWRQTADLLWVKFIATPLILFVMAYPFVEEKVALYTLLVISSTPTAINAVLTARLYRLNIHIATASFVLTTGFYLFLFVPILFWVLL